MKKKAAELDQAKTQPCAHCETYLLSGESPCTHGRWPNMRTLIETKKETESRERREKMERGRVRKIRKTQSEMEGVSVIDGCKDDEYDIERALLAIEGPSQNSKQKAKKVQTKPKTQGPVKETRNISSRGDRSSNPEGASANDCPPLISSMLHERVPVMCSSQADEDIQMHLKELLFGGKLLKEMVLDTNKVKGVGDKEGIVGTMDRGKVLPEQVSYDPCCTKGREIVISSIPILYI